MESIRPSGQHFSVDVALAAIYGLHEAFLIHHFQHWIRVNRDRAVNLHEGRTWSYQTIQQIADHFPFLDYEQVKYAIEKLEKFGVLKKGNFNKDPMNKTNWYAFEDEQIYVPSISKKSKNVYERENSLIDRENSLMERENSPIYIGKILKSENTKEPVVVVAPTRESFGPIEYTSCKGEKKVIDESDVYRYFVSMPKYKDVIERAIYIARKNTDPVNNMLSFIKGICNNIIEADKAKRLKEKIDDVPVIKKHTEQTVVAGNLQSFKELMDAKHRGEFNV